MKKRQRQACFHDFFTKCGDNSAGLYGKVTRLLYKSDARLGRRLPGRVDFQTAARLFAKSSQVGYDLFMRLFVRLALREDKNENLGS
jgi:hypothetical protein